MKCPFCECVDQHVVETRIARGGVSIRRRRECERCARRFTTYEVLERARVFVVKRDGTRQEFDREKLLAGMVIACRKRPISAATLVEVVDDVERQVFDSGDPEVNSAEIGRMVMERLINVDQVAYVRFASVYEQFNSPEEFARMVRALPLPSVPV